MNPALPEEIAHAAPAQPSLDDIKKLNGMAFVATWGILIMAVVIITAAAMDLPLPPTTLKILMPAMAMFATGKLLKTYPDWGRATLVRKIAKVQIVTILVTELAPLPFLAQVDNPDLLEVLPGLLGLFMLASHILVAAVSQYKLNLEKLINNRFTPD